VARAVAKGARPAHGRTSPTNVKLHGEQTFTNQVRGIARVVTDVANGQTSGRKLVLEAKGEIEQARRNDQTGMIGHARGRLPTQVTTVAREVGIEGKLGGQARRAQGRAGPRGGGPGRQTSTGWAANLTTQVRAIRERGHRGGPRATCPRSIDVEALGEVGGPPRTTSTR